MVSSKKTRSRASSSAASAGRRRLSTRSRPTRSKGSGESPSGTSGHSGRGLAYAQASLLASDGATWTLQARESTYGDLYVWVGRSPPKLMRGDVHYCFLSLLPNGCLGTWLKGTG